MADQSKRDRKLLWGRSRLVVLSPSRDNFCCWQSEPARLLGARAYKIVALDWQVESGLRTAAFLSATSSDLGECRRRTSSILLEAGILPVVQDYFGPDPRTIEGLLLDKIMAADVVVCLVGLAFGAAPIVDGKVSRRSYTQMEYEFAVRYGKPIYIFVA